MEKREYQRTRIDVSGVFLLPENTTVFREFTGILEDISEGGIKIVVDNVAPSAPIDSINIDDIIHFTGMDEYVYIDKNRVQMIEGDARVVRKDYEDGKIVLGCKLTPLTNTLADYIRDKKTSSFLISMKK